MMIPVLTFQKCTPRSDGQRVASLLFPDLTRSVAFSIFGEEFEAAAAALRTCLMCDDPSVFSIQAHFEDESAETPIGFYCLCRECFTNCKNDEFFSKLNNKLLDFLYGKEWDISGHWRAVSKVGKDPTGIYRVPGKTWVSSHQKSKRGIVERH